MEVKKDNLDIVLRIDRAFQKLKYEHEQRMKEIDRMDYIVPICVVLLFVSLWAGAVVNGWRQDSVKLHKQSCLTDAEIAAYLRGEEYGE